MKIEKEYLRKNRNKEDQTCKVAIEVPWNRTSLSSVMTHLDDEMEEDMRGVCAVVEYTPLSYNPETQTLVLEVVIDVQDIDFEDED